MRIHHYVEEQARLHPHQIAVVDQAGSLSYEDLLIKANQLAYHLHMQGVQAGDFVPILMQRSVHAFVAILAVLKLEAVYVPLNTLMPKTSLQRIVDNVNPKLVVLDDGYMNAIRHTTKINLSGFDYSQFNHDFSSPNTNNPQDLCYTIFTSGTTGIPKGVMVTHQALIQTFLSWQKEFGLKATDRHLQLANLGFDVFTGEWVRALCSGASLVILPDDYLLKPKLLYNYLLDQSINSAEFVPAVLLRLANYLKENSNHLQGMDRVICGSDLITVKEFEFIHSFCGPKTRLINSYGLSEATIDSLYFEYDASVLSELDEHSLVPVGKPFPHVSAYVVDENHQELGFGVEGELLIGGSALAEGYWNQPELTQQKFINLNLHKTERVFCTGDKAYSLKDGNILFVGRNDFIAKVNGVRVELSAVEGFLKEVPEIDDAIVIAVPMEDQASKIKLCAYVVSSKGLLSSESLLEHLRDKNLPRHAYPAEFYQIENIPLNMNGKKIRKPECFKVIRRLALNSTIVSPRTEMEQKIWKIWADILRDNHFGITNSFYECGGDSIKYCVMAEKVEKKLGMRLKKMRMRNLTIREIAGESLLQ